MPIPQELQFIEFSFLSILLFKALVDKLCE